MRVKKGKGGGAMENKTNTGLPGGLLILLAGVFWGSMGIFTRPLNAFGFSSLHLVFLRLGLGAAVFALLLLARGREGLRIRARDIPLFLGLGLVSVLFFTFCYFRAIELLPLSTAAILLYTSPIWVMLMSALLFRERITARKLLALVLAFAGCVLVSGVSGGQSAGSGLIFGLGAGFGYALYSILGTVALRRYRPMTVTFYTFLIAAAGSLLLCDRPALLNALAAVKDASMLWLIPVAAVVTAVVPYLAYTKGLQTTEASRAAILATVEPVVATVLGALVYRERLSLPAFLGILSVLAAIVLLNVKGKQE